MHMKVQIQDPEIGYVKFRVMKDSRSSVIYVFKG